MSFTVITKSYDAPSFCEREILRYAGYGKIADTQITELMNECIKEISDEISYKVCYCALPVSINKNEIDLGAFCVKSKALAKNLSECEKVIVFAATIGTAIDRLIAKSLITSPAKAVMLDAIGTERIEALCDLFCQELGFETAPRFSPGYGDLDIDCQKTLFSLLDCSKHIGLSLCDSMFMTPTKSVTAFVGIKR